MTTKGNSALKYAGAAMAVGGTVMLGSALLTPNSSAKKKAKKTAVKAIDAIDSMLTNVQNWMK